MHVKAKWIQNVQSGTEKSLMYLQIFTCYIEFLADLTN